MTQNFVSTADTNQGPQEWQPPRRPSSGPSWPFLALLLVFGIYALSVSPLFEVQAVVVEGDQPYPLEELLVKAGLSGSVNIFRIDARAVETRLRQDPRIKMVTMKRRLPSTIVLQIQARRPALTIAFGDLLLGVDASGVCLGPQQSSLGQVPILTGVSFVSATPGKRIPHPDMQVALEIANQLSPPLRQLISEINISDKENIIMYTRTLTRVQLGGPEQIPDKLATLEAILEEVGPTPYQMIDLRYPSRPVAR